MSILETLKSIRHGSKLSADQVFEAIVAAATHINDGERENDTALEIGIRLLEASRIDALPNDCLEPVEHLIEELGLYPYVDPQNFGLLGQSVIEAHAVELKQKRYLHAKQMEVFLSLLSGENVVLSAPTSFGKSMLVDAFISKVRPHRVVMILPTIALIDETRRRLSATFSQNYQIITTTSEPVVDGSHVIFVLTQERFLQRKEDDPIDLLFIDEFYKLDPARDDGRFESLNLALYKALPKARQCFMAGPHIKGIHLGERWTGNFKFFQTDYRTVTVNIVDHSGEGGDKPTREEAFILDLKSVGSESSLVFTQTPGSARAVVKLITDAGISFPTHLATLLGEWIRRNYHDSWDVALGTSNGVAIHHGRLPRSLGQLFVRLFDDREIKVLVCTSTLIEGVNTTAANVFIYDKKINRTDFDFFSFANIRGRVGRMMRHFVGTAFIYHEPPAAVETNVTVPVLANPSGASDFIVMNVDRAELPRSGQERQERLPFETGLSAAVLKEHGAIGVDLLVSLREQIEIIVSTAPARLLWSGFPNKDQRVAIAELALLVAHARREQTAIHSPAQVGWAWDRLRACRTLPAFLRWFSRTFSPTDESSGVDQAFQFLQACEFSFPRSIAATEAIVAEISGSEVSYGPFLTGLENWFRQPWIKELDEAGIPVPLGERLAQHVGSVDSRAAALSKIALLDLGQEQFDDVDRFIINHALGRHEQVADGGQS